MESLFLVQREDGFWEGHEVNGRAMAKSAPWNVSWRSWPKPERNTPHNAETQSSGRGTQSQVVWPQHEQGAVFEKDPNIFNPQR